MGARRPVRHLDTNRERDSSRECGRLDGFADVSLKACLQRTITVSDSREGSHGNSWNPLELRVGGEKVCSLNSAHTFELEVHENHPRVMPARDLDRVGAIRACQHVIPSRSEEVSHQVATGLMVFDH